MDAILNSNSCSIHIRRGDYVTLGWALEVEHYRKLIEDFLAQCEGEWELFVFSDDIDWCKEHCEEDTKLSCRTKDREAQVAKHRTKVGHRANAHENQAGIETGLNADIENIQQTAIP